MKISSIAGASALAALIAVGQPASADVAVRVNGDIVDFSPPPIVQAGRVFVPLRGVFERLGASVVYDNGSIDAQGAGRDISLHIDSTSATINGQAEILDVAPFIVGASTFVPLRFVSEALGASVNYDGTDSEVSITTAGSTPQYVAPVADTVDNDGVYASYAPPALPSYAQPELAAPNELWQPGYWAWGPYGYYWVPGTWVEPPQPGYYWTPGYWHVDHARYAWSNGFWGITIGFYGGVNYGNGYFGHGYQGGRWQGRTFQYNTYVSHVNTTIVKNVYIDKTVIVNNHTTRIGYNGGASGVQAQPNARELEAARQTHLKVTAAQVQHLKIAEQDRNQLATVNHDKPPVVAVARPLTVDTKPVGFEAVRPVTHTLPKFRAVPRAPVVDPAIAHPLPQKVAHPATIVRPPTDVTPHYRAPVRTPAPVVAPVATAAPVYHAPVFRRPEPAYHAPVAAPGAVADPIVHAPIVQPARVIPPPPHVATPAFHPAPAFAPAVRTTHVTTHVRRPAPTGGARAPHTATGNGKRPQ